MTVPENGKMAYAILQENLKEISEMIKRTGDRMTVVLGATITGFGLIIKLDDSAPSNLSLLFLVVSIVSLVLTFIFAIVGLFPKQGEQPGTTDIDRIWAEQVDVSQDSALANAMNDLCRVIRQRREINIRMNRWFKLTIIASAIALICVSLSEALASIG